MTDKITMEGRYALRGSVDEQGRLKPGREPVRVLSVTLNAPKSVCYQAQGAVYRVYANGSHRLVETGCLDLVPVLELEYVRWGCAADVPFGAVFAKRGDDASVMLTPTKVGSDSISLRSTSITYRDLFEKYAWTLDGKTWCRCWKQVVRTEPSESASCAE